MTAPNFAAPDVAGQWGLGSPAGQQEFAAFNAMRDSVLQSLMARSQAMMASYGYGAPPPLDPRTGQPQASGLTQAQSTMLTAPPHVQQVTPQSSDTDLIGAAKWYGIPEEAASQMPRDQLAAVINQHRQSVQPSEATAWDRLKDEPWALASVGLSGLTGAAESITSGIQRLPIIGEAVSRIQAVHQADTWLRSLDEGLRASNPASMDTALGLSRDVGNFAMMALPVAGTWAMMGKVAGGAAAWTEAFGSTWGPIARAAGMGSATAFALNGRYATEPVTDAVANAVRTGDWQNVPSDVLQNINTSYHQIVSGQLEQGLGALTAGLGEYYGPKLLEAAKRILGRKPLPPELGPVPVPPDHLATLQGLAAQGDPQAQQMLDVLQQNPRPTAGPAELGPLTAIQHAEATATQLNQVASIVQGPALPEALRATNLDDPVTVASSMLNNPGGVNIIQGVGDPASIVERVKAHVQFVQRGPRLDALVSDEPITQQMMDEYSQHGMFTGQSALLPNGVEGRVTGVNEGIVSVRPAMGGAEFYVKPEDIMPRLNTAHAVGDDMLWNDYNDYANQRTQATQEAMGGALSPEQMLTIRTQNAPAYMQDWFQDRGFTEPGQQARLRSYFNIRYVDSFKMAVPQEFAQAEAAQTAAANTPPRFDMSPTARLDRAAAMKGFVAVPDPSTGKWTLRQIDEQMMNPQPTSAGLPVQATFASREAAEAFVRTYDPQAPDISPSTLVPGEILGAVPTEAQQMPNTNPRQFGAGIEAINDAGELDGDFVGRLQERADLLQRTGKLEQLNNEYTRGVSRLQFMSAVFRNMDTALRGAGLDMGVMADYANVLKASDLMLNYEAPWLERLAGINAQVRPSLLESGDFALTSEIQDDAQRLARAQELGFKPAEIQAMADRAQVYRDLFGETGLDPLREIQNYASHVVKRQSTMGAVPQVYDEFQGLSKVTQPFYEYVRSGQLNVNMRELDPRILDRVYLRSLAWKQHMDDVYAPIAAKYQQLAQQIPSLQSTTDVLGNWLRIVKYGYSAEDQAGRATIHGIFQMIPGMGGITENQANSLFNGAMNNTYNSLLGFQPHILARDGLRLLFAAPKVGPELGKVIAEYANPLNTEGRQAMWKFAYDSGISRTGLPMLNRPYPVGESPLMMASESATNAAQAAGDVSALPDKQGALLRFGEAMHSWIGDRLPVWWRDPTPSSLSPMYWVGKQAETMKMFVGNAMYRRVDGALAGYNPEGGAAAMNDLLSASGVSRMKEASRNLFSQMVRAGDVEGAKVYAARQMVDDTMFRYGSLETPQAFRSTFGRLFMQMGNFADHVVQYTVDGLRNGSVMDRIKFGASAVGVFAGLDQLSKTTGWNFQKMNPYMGVGFSGGPWLEPVMTGVYGGSEAVVHWLSGDDSPHNQQQFSAAGQALGDVGRMLNPLGGVMATGERIGNAMQSTEPGMALARAFVTGEPGVYQDYANQMAPQMRQVMENSLQPQNGPVRAQGWGMPAVPQQPVYPPTMPGGPATGQALGPQTQPPGVVPAPGGQPYAPRPLPGTYGAPQGPQLAPVPNPSQGINPDVRGGIRYSPLINPQPHGAQQ